MIFLHTHDICKKLTQINKNYDIIEEEYNSIIEYENTEELDNN